MSTLAFEDKTIPSWAPAGSKGFGQGGTEVLVEIALSKQGWGGT